MKKKTYFKLLLLKYFTQQLLLQLKYFFRGNPDIPNNDGCTALHLSAAAGQLHCLVFLTNSGGNVYSVNDNGETPIQIATNKGRVACVRHLDTIITHQFAQDRSIVEKIQAKANQDADRRIRKKLKQSKKLEKRYARSRDVNKKRKISSTSFLSRSISDRNGIRKFEMNFNEGKAGFLSPLLMKQENRELESTSESEALFDDRIENEIAMSDDTITTNLTGSVHSSEFADVLYAHPPSFPTPNIAASINSLPSFTNNFIQSGHLYRSLFPDDEINEPSLKNRSTQGKLMQSVSSKESTSENEEFFMETLYTFLHVLNLDELRDIFLREKIDLRACLLCEDSDLQEIGLPLGQRKIILNAIKKRKKKYTSAKSLDDSAV